jgi:hypothetical protein
LFELSGSDGNSASLRADSRMHRSYLFTCVGIASDGFFLVIAITQATPLANSPRCGLLIGALATVVFPLAGVAFWGGTVLSVTALFANPGLLTCYNLIATVVNAIGAMIFGFTFLASSLVSSWFRDTSSNFAMERSWPFSSCSMEAG